jgi:predicted dehydrogenase
MVYQPHRARGEVVALREILEQDLIGAVYMMKRGRSDYARRNDWQAFRRHGGGMLNNYGAHYIDQLLYLAGSRAERVTCVLRTVASLGDADDVVKVVIETADGTILDLDINMACAHPMTPWRILGERGSALFDEEEQAWRVRYFRQEELAELAVHDGLAAPERRYGSGETIPWREAVYPLADYPAIDFYQKCYEYFALDREPFVPVADTREVMRVIDVCRRDAE